MVLQTTFNSHNKKPTRIRYKQSIDCEPQESAHFFRIEHPQLHGRIPRGLYHHGSQRRTQLAAVRIETSGLYASPDSIKTFLGFSAEIMGIH